MSFPTIPTIPVAVLTAPQQISALLWQAAQSPPVWGVFDSSGNPMLDQDSVLEFSYRRRYKVSDFPVQAGSFASYNKVIQPFEIQLRFSKGGDQVGRKAFLNALESLVASLALFRVVTPDGTYDNCNPDRFEVIRKGANGAFWLTEVDLYLIQIIEVTSEYATTSQFYPGISLYNAQSPAAQPIANQGNVQPQTPTSAQTAAAQSAMQSASSGNWFSY